MSVAHDKCCGCRACNRARFKRYPGGCVACLVRQPAAGSKRCALCNEAETRRHAARVRKASTTILRSKLPDNVHFASVVEL